MPDNEIGTGLPGSTEVAVGDPRGQPAAYAAALAPTDEIRVASAFFRPLPQPHEPWEPEFVTGFSYKMAAGESLPVWFRVRADGPATLTLGGADAGKYTAAFFKPFGQTVDNSNAFQRASLVASPLGTYYDPLNPIPPGNDNFVPEVPGRHEYVYCVLTCDRTTDPGDHSLAISLNGESLNIAIHCWRGVRIPRSPTRPLAVMSAARTVHRGIMGGYVDDRTEAMISGNLVDLLLRYRVTPYQAPIAIPPIVADGSLNLDLPRIGSYRQVFLSKVGPDDIKFWVTKASADARVRTLAYARAAEAAIRREGLTNMYLYVWDEPVADAPDPLDRSRTTAAAIKEILDHWREGSPSTRLLLTTTRTFDGSAAAAEAGLNFADYGSQLVLMPVINQVGGDYPPVREYAPKQFGFYTSCYGNCGPEHNADVTGGSDTRLVDFAYVDYPMVRRYAAVLLSCHSDWRNRVAFMLYYDAEHAWNDFNGTTTDPSSNPWLSARRFQVMGDGTLVYPAIPSYRPHAGVPAFSSDSRTGVPSIRLLYLMHASFMADHFEAYRVAHNDAHLADSLVSDKDRFSTSYADYESLRDRIGDALESGSEVRPASAVGLAFTVQPSGTNVNTPIAPAVRVAVVDRFGAVVTGSGPSQITVTKQTGTGALSGTLTRAVAGGVATFDNLKLDVSDTYTLSATATGLPAAASRAFSISAAETNLNNVQGLLHWYRADDVENRDGFVARWADRKVGASAHLSSAPGHSPPALIASAINGKPAAEFAGERDQLSQRYLGRVAPSAWFLVVFRITDNRSAGGIIGSWDRFNDWSLRYTPTKLVSLNVGGDAGGPFADGTTASDQVQWHWALAQVRNGGQHRVFVDGAVTPEVTTVQGAAAPESLRLGGLLSGNALGSGSGPSVLPGNLRIAEVAVFSDTFDVATGSSAIKDYVRARYGI